MEFVPVFKRSEEIPDSAERISILPTDLSNGQREVLFGDYTWRVLDIQDGKALLLSENIIELRSYDKYYVDNITWEVCALRKYLNETFWKSFTKEEQNLIMEVTNQNNDNQWLDTAGGNMTKDKIFLLSLEEVVHYFGDSGLLYDPLLHGNQRLDDEYNEARQSKYENRWTMWWLRSPGSGNAAVYVDNNGVIRMQGLIVGQNNCGVRPALWISL
jgi:hypothetical protein